MRLCLRLRPMRCVSSGTLLAICVSLLQAVTLLVTYVRLTHAISSVDDLDDEDGTCVPFANVFGAFVVIQALNWSFYVGCIIILNRMLAVHARILAKDADMDGGHEMRPLV